MDQSNDSLWKKNNNNNCRLTRPSYSLTCSFFSSPPGRLRDQKRIKHYGCPALPCPALPCPVKCVGKCPHQFTTGQRTDLRKKKRSRRAGRRASLHPPLNNNNERKLWRAETQAETTDTYRLATSERARERETERRDRDRGAHQTETEDRAMAVPSSLHLSKLLNFQPFLSTVTVISPSAFILTQGEEEGEKEEQTRLNKLPTTISQSF